MKNNAHLQRAIQQLLGLSVRLPSTHPVPKITRRTSPRRRYAPPLLLTLAALTFSAPTHTSAQPVFEARTGTDNPFDGADVGVVSTSKLADLDGDGDLDALVGIGGVGFSTGKLLYYENTGTAAQAVFEARTGTDNPLDGVDVEESGVRSPTLADLDGDGDLDALVGIGGFNPNSGKLFYYENTGTAAQAVFEARIGTDNPFDGVDVGADSSPTLADLDGDGDLDALVGENNGTLLYYENTGTAAQAVYVARADTDNPFDGVDVGADSSPTLTDLDGDGDLDALVGERDGILNYYENTGTTAQAVFEARTGADNPFDGVEGVWSRSPTLADLDGDGDLDALAGSSDGLRYFENTGTTAQAVFETRTGDAPGGVNVRADNSPTLADLDGDGDLDALVGDNYGLLRYYENTGTAAQAVFEARIGTDNPFDGVDVGHESSATLADLDGDGDLDALVGIGGGSF